MSLVKIALTLAFAGLAAHTIAQTRRSAPATGNDGAAADQPPGPSPLAMTVGPIPADAPLAGVDSPNEAERLQARGVSTPASAGAGGADLFDSTSQESAYARSPGLPDFARGA